jgi:hypothetical protein
VQTPDTAETIALRALSWIAGDGEMLGHFMNATGAQTDDLKRSAGDPVFLGSVLDFLLLDDAWVMAFCTAEGLDCRVPGEARAVLPGGATTHWT